MSSEPTEYRVLARKYRPQNFDALIGQDALVRTLSNAIESGRIAHAFMLTGVRGVGKTTTARIIAKALNYKGPDGNAGPTTGDTADCALCQAIAEDRHPDVLEMDAASRTGVDDIREILDGVRYAPSEARYKIYVIDEVHMLSKNAFNALLKTLEEPPEHVKFIFATTEIRKVPITVLSRCQRFDLRRVDVPTLTAHFSSICEKEGFKAEDEAIAMIARAADGSVRDGLSLLDQAMALAGESITTQQVQDMLGLADRARGLDLIEQALTGNMPEALEIMDELYRAGADPTVLIQDLLDITHTLTKLRAVPEAKEMKAAMAPDTIKRADDLANKLTMPTLGKAWQLLLRGLSEVQTAPNPQSAAEMVIIRLAYAADLPDPRDLMKKLKDQTEGQSGPITGGGAPAPDRSTVTAQGQQTGSPPAGSSLGSPPAGSSLGSSTGSGYVKSREGGDQGSSSAGGAQVAAGGGPRAALKTVPQEEAAQPVTEFKTLTDIVALLEQNDEYLLASQVYQFVHLVKLEEGRMEFRPDEQAPPKLAQDLGVKLKALTGKHWMISVSGAPGEESLAGQAQAAKQKECEEVLQHPKIQDILSVFPDAELVDVKRK